MLTEETQVEGDTIQDKISLSLRYKMYSYQRDDKMHVPINLMCRTASRLPLEDCRAPPQQ